MINKRNYLWALSLAFLLAACGKDDGPTAVYDNAYPLVVTAQNVGFEADKAAQLYAKGENIGVSMLEEGTDNLVEPYFNVGFNSGVSEVILQLTKATLFPCFLPMEIKGT